MKNPFELPFESLLNNIFISHIKEIPPEQQEEEKKSEELNYDKLRFDREIIKLRISSSLEKLGLSENQMKELFQIIDDAGNKIEKLKEPLLKNKAAQSTAKVMIKINQVTKQMQLDLKKKTDEFISKRKNKVEKLKKIVQKNKKKKKKK